MTGKVSGSADFKNNESFKAFAISIGKLCSCRGGDSKECTQIEATPEHPETGKHRAAWLASVSSSSDIIGLQVQTLWEVMKESEDKSVSDRAIDVETAFRWICANPAVHRTKCRFTITADWGEVALLNLSAFINKNDSNPPPTEDCVFTPTKISCGKEFSRKFERTYYRVSHHLSSCLLLARYGIKRRLAKGG